MGISYENVYVMNEKLGRNVRADTKVTLTGEALGRIMDAARAHERGKRQPSEIERIFDSFFNGRRQN